MGCSPWGREESHTTERLHFHFSLSCTGEGNGNPLQCSCLENPRDRGAWWAAVYVVAQSQTRLKRLSSSSIVFYVLMVFVALYEISEISTCGAQKDWNWCLIIYHLWDDFYSLLHIFHIRNRRHLCLKQIQKQTFFLKSVLSSQKHLVAPCLQSDILGNLKKKKKILLQILLQYTAYFSTPTHPIHPLTLDFWSVKQDFLVAFSHFM